MTIKIILATGRNGELGKDNKLLWHIPEDLKNFKLLTEGTICVQGRVTFEGICNVLGNNFGLPNRYNIVLSRKPKKSPWLHSYEHPTWACADMLLPWLKLRRDLGTDTQDISIIGGAQIYTEMLEVVDEIYHTLVAAEYPEADTTFDMSFIEDETVWEKVSTKCLTSEAKVMHYKRIKEYNL